MLNIKQHPLINVEIKTLALQVCRNEKSFIMKDTSYLLGECKISTTSVNQAASEKSVLYGSDGRNILCILKNCTMFS